jgi:hypothetical protein
MKWQVATWSLIGFSIACLWVLYTFLASAESLQRNLREPLFRSLFVSCPILFLPANTNVEMKFWWIPPINAATFALVGAAFCALRQKWLDRFHIAPARPFLSHDDKF